MTVTGERFGLYPPVGVQTCSKFQDHPPTPPVREDPVSMYVYDAVRVVTCVYDAVRTATSTHDAIRAATRAYNAVRTATSMYNVIRTYSSGLRWMAIFKLCQANQGSEIFLV